MRINRKIIPVRLTQSRLVQTVALPRSTPSVLVVSAAVAAPPPRVHADSRLPPMLMDDRTRRGLKEARDKSDDEASAGPKRPRPPSFPPAPATASPLPLMLNPSPSPPRPLLLEGELNRATRPPDPYPCCSVGLAMVREFARTSWPPGVVVVEPPPAPLGDLGTTAIEPPPLSLLSDRMPLKPIFSRCLFRRAILECSFRPPSCCFRSSVFRANV